MELIVNFLLQRIIKVTADPSSKVELENTTQQFRVKLQELNMAFDPTSVGPQDQPSGSIFSRAFKLPRLRTPKNPRVGPDVMQVMQQPSSASLSTPRRLAPILELFSPISVRVAIGQECDSKKSALTLHLPKYREQNAKHKKHNYVNQEHSTTLTSHHHKAKRQRQPRQKSREESWASLAGLNNNTSTFNQRTEKWRLREKEQIEYSCNVFKKILKFDSSSLVDQRPKPLAFPASSNLLTSAASYSFIFPHWTSSNCPLPQTVLKMATIALASLAPAPEEPVHLLPCTIAHDGPAKVSTYFVITPEHSLPAEKTDPPRSAKKEEADEVVATLGSQSKEEDEAARATVDSPLLRGDETQDSGYASVADGSPRLSGTEELALRGSKSGTQTAHGWHSKKCWRLFTVEASIDYFRGDSFSFDRGY